MTNAINRRAFLRTAASASAVAAGVGAVTIATAGEHPDAKLLALAPELERLYAEHLIAEPRYSEAYSQWKAVVGEEPTRGTSAHEEWLRWSRSEGDKVRLKELAKATDGLYNAAHDVADLMIATPAVTIGGLAAKAKALKFDLGMVGNGDPREDWDYDKEVAFGFLCEIERMAQARRA